MNDTLGTGAAIRSAADEALAVAGTAYDRMREALGNRLRRTASGRAALADSEQHCAHSFAWFATVVEGPAPDAVVARGIGGRRLLQPG